MMEDWIAKAINSVRDYIPTDVAVAKDALTCNRWIASSALQKAIRRDDIAIAQRAALALHREDRPATWRRLIAIAFEDVGPADINVVVETVAVATSSNFRAAHGEEEVLASIVCRLATAPKDRSADYLMWVAAEHPDQRETRALCGCVSVTECLSMVTDLSRSLADRAVATWFCSGINYPYQHRVGAGDLVGLADAYCGLGAPPDLVAATVLAAKRTRQPYVALVPLVWLEVQRSGLTGGRRCVRFAFRSRRWHSALCTRRAHAFGQASDQYARTAKSVDPRMLATIRAAAALDRCGTARGFLCRRLGGVPAITLGKVAIVGGARHRGGAINRRSAAGRCRTADRRDPRIARSAQCHSYGSLADGGCRCRMRQHGRCLAL